MKKIYTFIVTFFCVNTLLLAQVPKQLNYQGVARDNNNLPLPNRNITLRLSILDNTGATIYSERHNPTTNAMGLFTVKIGTGLFPSTNFQTINWASGERYLETAIDANGGSNFVTVGSPIPFAAVPYALVADTVLRAPRASITGVAAGGDLTGTYPDPLLGKLFNRPLDNALPTNGQIIGFDGTKWKPINAPTGGATYTAGTGITIQNNTISANIPTALPPNGTASGDLSGSYPNPTVAKLQGRNISTTAPTDGQVLQYSSANGAWQPTNLNNIISIDNSNYQSINFTPINQIVLIQQNITLSADYNKLSGDRIMVVGGYFLGNGSQKISFSTIRSSCHDMRFSNLRISGGNFYNCFFENCIFESVGDLDNCIVSAQGNSAGQIKNSLLQSSTLSIQRGVVNSEIFGSTITTTLISGNAISSSTINLAGTSTCTDNKLSSSLIQITNILQVKIANNIFSTPLTGQTALINADLVSSSVFVRLTITDNDFNSNRGTNKAISLNGTNTGFNGMVKISGNNFINGTGVEYQSNVRTLVSDNFYQNSLSTGLSSSQLTLQSNYSY